MTEEQPTTETPPATKPGRLPLMLLLLAVTVVYLPVLRYPFVALDDGLHVYANPFLNPVTWKGLATLWRHPYSGLYAPVAYSCYAAIATLARMRHLIAT